MATPYEKAQESSAVMIRQKSVMEEQAAQSKEHADRLKLVLVKISKRRRIVVEIMLYQMGTGSYYFGTQVFPEEEGKTATVEMAHEYIRKRQAAIESKIKEEAETREPERPRTAGGPPPSDGESELLSEDW